MTEIVNIGKQQEQAREKEAEIYENIAKKDAEVEIVRALNANERAQVAKEQRIAVNRGLGAYHKNKADAQDREKFMANVEILVNHRNGLKQALDKTNTEIADLCADHFYEH